MRDIKEVEAILNDDNAHHNTLLQETDRQMCLRILIHRIRLLKQNNQILQAWLRPIQSSCILGCVMV